MIDDKTIERIWDATSGVSKANIAAILKEYEAVTKTTPAASESFSLDKNQVIIILNTYRDEYFMASTIEEAVLHIEETKYNQTWDEYALESNLGCYVANAKPLNLKVEEKLEVTFS